MKRVIIFSFAFIVLSCEKKYSPEETKNNLKNAMIKFLASEKDTTRAKFEIVDVYYFPEKTFYTCDFRVRMKVIGSKIDTVGTMRATISKDFETVKRKW